jgi:hypothetical protein
VPSMRSLFVVDAEGFSRNRDRDLPGLHTEIRRIVAAAAARSGLGEALRAAPFAQSRGDGILAALPLEATAPLVAPFADELQHLLARSAARLRAGGLRLRLRAAVHFGLVDDEDPVTGGISTATNEVCRLVDCAPLRAALEDSDPDVTFAALVVSAEVFREYVRGGHTGLAPSRFTEVRAAVKDFDRPAYLYVPTPSRRPSDEEEGAPEAEPPPGGMTFGRVTVTGTQNVVGHQGGDIRQELS